MSVCLRTMALCIFWTKGIYRKQPQIFDFLVCKYFVICTEENVLTCIKYHRFAVLVSMETELGKGYKNSHHALH